MTYLPRTANEAYGIRRQETLDKLAELHRLLCEKADADQARTPRHWTHAEELAYINGQLDNIIEFIRS